MTATEIFRPISILIQKSSSVAILVQIALAPGCHVGSMPFRWRIGLMTSCVNRVDTKVPTTIAYGSTNPIKMAPRSPVRLVEAPGKIPSVFWVRSMNGILISISG